MLLLTLGTLLITFALNDSNLQNSREDNATFTLLELCDDRFYPGMPIDELAVKISANKNITEDFVMNFSLTFRNATQNFTHYYSIESEGVLHDGDEFFETVFVNFSTNREGITPIVIIMESLNETHRMNSTIFTRANWIKQRVSYDTDRLTYFLFNATISARTNMSRKWYVVKLLPNNYVLNEYFNGTHFSANITLTENYSGAELWVNAIDTDGYFHTSKVIMRDEIQPSHISRTTVHS